MSRPSGGRWGQNFLTDPAVALRISERVAGRAVIEVGPGGGALTRPMLDGCPRVVAVEIDPRLVARLSETFAAAIADGCLVLVEGDATTADWPALIDAASTRPDEAVALAANLPYQAGTAIVLRFLEMASADHRLDPAVVMLQLEVAERIVAEPRTKAYGSLSVLAQATHDARLLFKVGSRSFRPRPQVTSAVVELTRRDEPAIPPGAWRSSAAFVHRAFSQRRKQLARSLAGADGRDRAAWRERMSLLGHSPDARAEELRPDEILALRSPTPAHETTP